jgi:hypothetical protein
MEDQMAGFQPAFEVTRVESMQWNRTCFIGNAPSASTARDAAPMSPEILAQVQAAVKLEAQRAQR